MTTDETGAINRVAILEFKRKNIQDPFDAQENLVEFHLTKLILRNDEDLLKSQLIRTDYIISISSVEKEFDRHTRDALTDIQGIPQKSQRDVVIKL